VNQLKDHFTADTEDDTLTDNELQQKMHLNSTDYSDVKINK